MEGFVTSADIFGNYGEEHEWNFQSARETAALITLQR